MTAPTKERSLRQSVVGIAIIVLGVATLAPATASGRAIRLTGTVVDSGGRPFAGANVELRPVRTGYQRHLAWLREAPSPPAPLAVTDPQGRFLLLAPESDGLWRLKVTAPRHGGVSAVLPLVHAVELGEVLLRRAEPIALQLKSSTGESLSSARVVTRIASPSTGSPIAQAVVFERSYRADQHGNVEIEADERTPLELWVCAASGAGAFRVEAPADRLEIELPAAPVRKVQVRSRDGAPVVKAVVRVDGVPCGLTDAQGSVELAADEKAVLRAEGPSGAQGFLGLGSASRNIPSPPGSSSPIVLVLDVARVAVRGLVSSAPDGSALAGALVWSDRDPAWHAVTDANGAYSLSLLTLGLDALEPERVLGSVRAAAPWFLESSVPLRARQVREGTGPALTMAPAAIIEGVVLDEQQRPVAGATVATSGLQTSAASITAENGRFELALMASEQGLQLVAGKDGYPPTWIDIPRLITQQPLRVTLELSPGKRLVGRVVAASGAPVPQANVTAFPAVGSGDLHDRSARQMVELGIAHVPVASTAEDGSFELWPAAGNAFELEVTASGFVTARFDRRIPAAEDREPEDGSPRQRNARPFDVGTLELSTGREVEGVVVDTAGPPLPGASVTASRRRPPNALAQRDASGPAALGLTDEQGRFSLRDLPQEALQLDIRRRGFIDATIVVPARELDQPLRIVLERAFSVSGHVVDGGGQPIADATVALRAAHAAELGQRGATSDPTGSFTVDGLSQGMWLLTAKASEYLDSEERAVELGDDVPDRELQVVLESGATLSGTVLDVSGAPLPQTLVEAFPGGRNTPGFRCITDERGHYRIDRLPPGLVIVSAHRSSHRPVEKEARLDSGQNRLDLRLEPGWSIVGRVVDALTGDAVAEARVAALPSGADSPLFVRSASATLTAQDGSFTLSISEPGSFVLSVAHRSYAPYKAMEPISIPDDAGSSATVELERGATVSGLVRGLDAASHGMVLVDAVSEIASSGHGYGVSGKVSPDGRYRLEAMGAGVWEIEAVQLLADGGSRIATARVEIAPGALEEHVDLDLEPPGRLSLSGQVLRGGEPEAGATVSVAVRSDSRYRFVGGGGTDTTSDGRFEIHHLEPGTYLLSTTPASAARGARPHIEEVELRSDLEVTVELAPYGSLFGTVLDRGSGEPVAGVRIEVEATDQPAFANFGVRAVAPPRQSRVLTDLEGSFRLDRLDHHTYRVRAFKRGYAQASEEVSMDSGGEPTSVTLELERGSELSLELFGPDGDPVAQPTAVVLGARGDVVASASSPLGNGHLVLEDVPDGEWTLLASGTGQCTLGRPISLPASQLTVGLPPCGGVSVVVGNDSVSPLSVRLIDSSGIPYSALSDRFLGSEWRVGGGRVSIANVPVGRWRVEVHDLKGELQGSSEIVVQEGRTTAARLSLP